MAIIGQYTEAGHIRRASDGAFVPPDPANQHYRDLMAMVEAGAEITPYQPPAPVLPNLFPDQFWFGLRASGYEDDVRTWVAALNNPDNPDYDPVAWAWASSKLEFATFFERDHPLVESFRQAMDMPEAELDALWKFAAGI